MTRERGQPWDDDDPPTLAEIIVNELAFRSLNMVDREPPEKSAEAISMLAERVRQGSLAIYLGLVRIAEAIEAREEDER